MATNYVNGASTIEYSNTGSAIASGDIVVMGDIVGVAITDIAATTGVGTVQIEGAFTVAKISGTAWNVGDAVDWDASAGAFGKGITSAAGDVTTCAVCVVAAAAGDTTAVVKLVPGAGTGI